jgi:hypothetical protein
MGVGAEALELSVGGFGEGTPGAAGSGSVSVVGCVVVAFWRAVCVAGSIGEMKPKFLSVKTEHALIARDSGENTKNMKGGTT